jgi:hypothetical protein
MWTSDIGEILKAIFGIVVAVVLAILYWQSLLFIVIFALLTVGLPALWKRSPRLASSVVLALISVALFGGAIIFQSTTGLYFLAGIPALASLYFLNGFLDAAKPKRRFARTLLGNLIEVAAIFTGVAGAYTAVSLYLGDQLLGSITLRELMQFDGAMLSARAFMDALKPSPLQSLILAASFLGLLWVERYSTDRCGKTVEKAWRYVQGGTKWAGRAGLLTLFAASFTFLAVYGSGPASQINARLRDFRQAYTQLQGNVGQGIDRQVKRELMAKAWAQMDAAQQRLLEQSVANRKAAQTLAEHYEASQVLGLHDPEIERIVARDAGSIAQEKDAESIAQEEAGSVAQEKVQGKGAKPVRESASPPPPDRYQDVSLETIRNAAREAQEANEVIKEETLPGPLEDMESSIKSGLMDMALEHGKEQLRFFDALNSHIPGLGELLNSISDALTETLAERKRAQDQTVERAVSSPRPRLLEIEREQARGVSRRASLRSAKSAAPAARPLLSTSSSLSLSVADAVQIRRAESRLVQQIRAIETDELLASRTRSRDMAKQADKLPGESTLDFSESISESIRKSRNPLTGLGLTRDGFARWEGPPPSSKLAALKTIKTFADTQLTLDLERQLEREARYQEKIETAAHKQSGFGMPGYGSGSREGYPAGSLEEQVRERLRKGSDERYPFHEGREPIRLGERPFIPRVVP